MNLDEPIPEPPAEPVRWTPRTYLLLAFGALLAVSSIALRDPVPLFAGLPFLLAPVLAGLHVPVGLADVDLSWQTGGLGADVVVTGLLRGNFGSSARDVGVVMPAVDGVTELGPIRYTREPTAIRFTLRWRLHEPSILTVPPPRVVLRDPLGLTERTLEGARPILMLERYPPGLQRTAQLRLQRTIPAPGESRSRTIGPSGEFFGIRAADPSEPPRRINWRASARAGHLLANDYQLERTGDLVVLLDVRPSDYGPEFDERLLGVARAAVYGIAESFLRAKVRIGFAAFGEFVEAVPLSTGRIHRVRLLRAILASRRAEVAGPSERCALGLRRFYRPGVTVLVVSSWAGDPTFDLVPYVRRQGFPVVLLSPSPLPMRRGTGGLDPADEPIAVRLERLERRVRLSDLWVHGPVVDWDDYWTLEPLARVLRRPTYRRVS